MAAENISETRRKAQEGDPQSIAKLSTNPAYNGTYYRGLLKARAFGPAVVSGYTEAYRDQLNKRAKKQPTTPKGFASREMEGARGTAPFPKEKQRLLSGVSINPAEEAYLKHVVECLFVNPNSQK